MKLQIAKGLLVALALAQLFDVLSTNAALAQGLHESNPIMRLAMDWLGRYWWVYKAGLGVFFIAYAIKLQTVTLRTFAILSGVAKVYVLVVLSNIFGWL